MKKEVFDQYLRAIESFRKNEAISFNEDLLSENINGGWTKEITITCKNYEQQGGLSKALHSAKKEDLYQIKALMGKGLQLDSEGTFVAFVGGTGVLVFLDLVALMIRHSLGLLPKGTCPILESSSNFKFVLFASYHSREEAVGIELLEGLRDICQKKGLTNFELNLRIKSESSAGQSVLGASRWDQDFIRRQIEVRKKETGGLRKVYVCGPPTMNELFDRTFDSMIALKELSRTQVEVM